MTTAADIAVPAQLSKAGAAIMIAAQTSSAKGDHPSRRLLATALAKVQAAKDEQHPRERGVLLTDAHWYTMSALIDGPGGSRAYRKAMARAISNTAAAVAFHAADQGSNA